MKLKQIEKDMIVHCKTEDEAKILIKWAYECGYEWGGKNYRNEDTFFNGTKNKNGITYHFWNDGTIGWGNPEIFADNRSIEFIDLIISEEPNSMATMAKLQTDSVVRETMKMSAEEILQWLKKYDCDKVMADVFSYGDVCINDFYDVLEEYTPDRIVEMIEAYEANKKQKKEVDVEWVYHIYNYNEHKDEFFNNELVARKRCEKIVKSNPNVYACYKLVCRVKQEV